MKKNIKIKKKSLKDPKNLPHSSCNHVYSSRQNCKEPNCFRRHDSSNHPSQIPCRHSRSYKVNWVNEFYS